MIRPEFSRDLMKDRAQALRDEAKRARRARLVKALKR